MLNSLSDEQRDAVLCQDPRVVCLAGAGTGKTHCMIAKIKYLVDSGTDPESILVLTFTNSAAFEMKSRYMSICEAHEHVPTFCTFHSFCYKLLCDFKSIRIELGYRSVPQIASDIEIENIHRNAELVSGVKYSASKRRKFDKLSKTEQFEQQVLIKQIHKLFLKSNLISFDDLSESVSKLFVEDNYCVSWAKDRYKYLFVDEFQDTDPTQYNFLMSFTNSHLFVIGDIHQAIYSFRGADSSILKSLLRSSKWTVKRLTHNRRSTKEICEYANKHCSIADTFSLELISDKSGDHVDEVILSEFDIPSYVTDHAVQWSQLPGSTAVLVRTNAEVRQLQNLFENLSLNYSSKHIASWYHVVRSAESKEYENLWLASMLSADNYYEWCRMQQISDMSDSQLETRFFQDDRIQTAKHRIAEIRTSIDSGEDIEELLNHLGMQVNISDDVRQSYKSRPYATLNDVLVSHQDADRDLYIGTIHSVKGLEYSNVILIGVSGRSFKLNCEDNYNLYYVGATRAKCHLEVIKVR